MLIKYVPSTVKKKHAVTRVANELLVIRAIRERVLFIARILRIVRINRKLGPSYTRATLVASLLSAFERYFPYGRD